MKNRVFSQSLKKMKKHEVFDYGIDKLILMQKQIKREENIIKPRQKPIKSIIDARKEMISHRFSKNNIEKQVDQVIKSLVDSKKLQLNTQKINRKHQYRHYRIQTQPVQEKNTQKENSLKRSKKILSVNEKNSQNPELILPKISPKISKSNSQNKFEKLNSRKLKTQQDLIERLYEDPKQKVLQYINIDNVIKHYRAGMTSMIKGVYFNPHNPYKKIPQ